MARASLLSQCWNPGGLSLVDSQKTCFPAFVIVQKPVFWIHDISIMRDARSLAVTRPFSCKGTIGINAHFSPLFRMVETESQREKPDTDKQSSNSSTEP